MQFRTLITLVALLFATGLFAQTTAERAGERAKNRAENRAQNNVDRKVDRAVDDAFNAVGNLFKKKNKKQKNKDGEAETTDAPAANENRGFSMPGMSSGPWEPYTNPISFSVRMEMAEEKKNGKVNNVAMAMAVTETEFGIKLMDEEANETTRMILNTQDGKTTMITTEKNGKQTGFRMRMPGVKQVTAETMEDVMEHITIEETSETRVIDGYNCRKYIVTDTKNNTTTESWVTTDAGINAQEIFSGMMNAFGAQAKKQKGGPTAAMRGAYDGFPILSITNDGKSTYTTRFRDLKVGEANMDKAVLNTGGVEIQSVGF